MPPPVATTRPPCCGNVGHHLRFALAEAFLALDLEHRRDAHAGTLFDDAVGIDERHAEPRCQSLAQCRLSRPHEADQIDVFFVRFSIHGDILPQPRSSPGKPAHRLGPDGSTNETKRRFAPTATMAFGPATPARSSPRDRPDRRNRTHKARRRAAKTGASAQSFSEKHLNNNTLHNTQTNHFSYRQ